MSIEILEQNGIVRSYNNILTYYGDRLGRYISETDLEEILQEGVEILYFNESSNTYTQTTNNEDEALVKVLKTKHTDKNGYEICISYVRGENNNWYSAIVGTQYFIHNKWYEGKRKEWLSAGIIRPDDSARERQVVYTNTLELIYQNIFYKESWKSEKGDLLKLDDYLKALKRKLENMLKKGDMSNIIVLNKSKDKVLFNSRLIDHYSNYIVLIASYSYRGIGEVEYVYGDKLLLENGFDPSVLSTLQPIEFFNRIDEVIFRGNMNEFNFTDTYALNHINERRSRLPESAQSMSPMDIVSKLKISVEYCIKMSKVDHNFIVPMYNLKLDKIQFLMPIYFSFAEGEQPIAALVVDKINGRWNIETILAVQDAYTDARLISTPAARWLRAGIM